MKQRVLILGHGRMGHAMEHLLVTRHDVRIWDIEEWSKAVMPRGRRKWPKRRWCWSASR